MKRYGSKRKWVLAGPFLILAAMLSLGCATTSPYSYNPNTVAATSFGMGALGTAFGARSIPTTYLLDKSGAAIAGIVGGAPYDGKESIALFSDLAAR